MLSQILILPGETMDSAQESSKTHRNHDNPAERDRRSHPRDGILSRIEDATYAVLRKHEKKSA